MHCKYFLSVSEFVMLFPSCLIFHCCMIQLYPHFFSFMSCELCIMLRKAFPTLRSFKILSCFLLLLLCFNFLPSNL